MKFLKCKVSANDIFEINQAKRLIPAIGSWSFIGKVLGIGLTLLPALLFLFGWVDKKVLTIGQVIRLNIFFYLIAFFTHHSRFPQYPNSSDCSYKRNRKRNFNRRGGVRARFTILSIAAIGYCFCGRH